MKTSLLDKFLFYPFVFWSTFLCNVGDSSPPATQDIVFYSNDNWGETKGGARMSIKDLNGRNEIGAGKPFWLCFILKNFKSETLIALKSNLLLDYTISVKGPDGNLRPKTLYGKQKFEEAVFTASGLRKFIMRKGDSDSGLFHINRMYDMTEYGNYSITINRALVNYHTNKKINVSSNVISIRVVKNNLGLDQKLHKKMMFEPPDNPSLLICVDVKKTNIGSPVYLSSPHLTSSKSLPESKSEYCIISNVFCRKKMMPNETDLVSKSMKLPLTEFGKTLTMRVKSNFSKNNLRIKSAQSKSFEFCFHSLDQIFDMTVTGEYNIGLIQELPETAEHKSIQVNSNIIDFTLIEPSVPKILVKHK